MEIFKEKMGYLINDPDMINCPQNYDNHSSQNIRFLEKRLLSNSGHDRLRILH